MAELADALGSGPSALNGHGGSSPLLGTQLRKDLRRCGVSPFLLKTQNTGQTRGNGSVELLLRGEQLQLQLWCVCVDCRPRIRSYDFHRRRNLSFASNCAAQRVDQRTINAWMGHQTEEMVRRYRHLIPDQQHHAIRAVFGDSPIQQRDESIGSRTSGL